jgi:hypothetical protein
MMHELLENSQEQEIARLKQENKTLKKKLIEAQKDNTKIQAASTKERQKLNLKICNEHGKNEQIDRVWRERYDCLTQQQEYLNRQFQQLKKKHKQLKQVYYKQRTHAENTQRDTLWEYPSTTKKRPTTKTTSPDNADISKAHGAPKTMAK